MRKERKMDDIGVFNLYQTDDINYMYMSTDRDVIERYKSPKYFFRSPVLYCIYDEAEHIAWPVSHYTRLTEKDVYGYKCIGANYSWNLNKIL